MRSLFRFLVRFHVLFLFLTLEIISFVLMFNYNNYQKVIFLNSSNRVSASVYSTFNKVVNYFRLTKMNEELSAENSELKNQLFQYKQLLAETDTTHLNKKLEPGKFKFISALVINNSVNKQYNYITLDKGRKQGVLPDRGIVSENGIVGIISNVSNSYSIAMSVLNKRLFISGKLKKNNYFGPITWDGFDYRYVRLNEIPPHVEIAVGDTIVTSGSSTYFPEGIFIGIIESFKLEKGESFYTIMVKLGVDFKSITYVDIIENFDKTEIKTLENLIQDDQDNQ